MKGRDPYQRALTALAGDAGAGRFGWGCPLVATTLATELGLSPTPVREALARLAGEGVIEHRPGRGYFAPSPDASDIVELYDLHRRLALWALDGGAAGPAVLEDDRTLPAQTRIERLFARLVAARGHAALAAAHRRVAIQLRPVRAAEEGVAPLEAGSVDRLAAASVEVRGDCLEAAIVAYHAERASHAQAVFASMRRSARSIAQI